MAIRNSRKIRSAKADDEENQKGLHAKERIAKPVPFLAFAEHDFPADHGDAEQAQAQEIERGAILAQFLMFGLEIIRVGHDGVAQEQGEQSDGNIEIKDPSPAVVVGDESTERRADDRREQRRDSEDGLSAALFFPRKRIQQNPLARRLQSASGQSLKHAEGDQFVQICRHSA